MDCTMKMPSSNIIPLPSQTKINLNNRIPCWSRYSRGVCIPRIRATALDGSAAHVAYAMCIEIYNYKVLQEQFVLPRLNIKSVNLATFVKLHNKQSEDGSSSVVDIHRKRSCLESLFCYDKPIPEERIEKPVGVSIEEKLIGDNSRCTDCQAKGAVLCATCSGSGLYVDSILESQGIIVKVRCLGCGGTGNIMCSDCGGRGHLGRK